MLLRVSRPTGPRLQWGLENQVRRAELLAFPVYALPLLAATLVMWRPTIIPDGDPFWHVAAGAWMLDHLEVTRTDPFMATDRSWTNLEWVSEIVMALAFRWHGIAGLHALFGLSTAATGMIIGRVFLNSWIPSMRLQPNSWSSPTLRRRFKLALNSWSCQFSLCGWASY
jgi:hypothetical protein